MFANTLVRTPIRSDYKPELDTSPELAAEGHSYYQELIGILRWAVELGRLDILLEVSLMSTYLAAPREGHLEQVFHIFGYLKKVPKRRIAFDPDYPAVDESRFKLYDWSDFYRDAEETVPPNAPDPLGKPVSLHCFVDAGRQCCYETKSDRHLDISESSTSGMALQETKYGRIEYLWIRNSRFEECHRAHQVFEIQTSDVWGTTSWPSRHLL